MNIIIYDTVHISFPHYAYNSLLPLALREKKMRFFSFAKKHRFLIVTQ